MLTKLNFSFIFFWVKSYYYFKKRPHLGKSRFRSWYNFSVSRHSTTSASKDFAISSRISYPWFRTQPQVFIMHPKFKTWIIAFFLNYLWELNIPQKVILEEKLKTTYQNYVPLCYISIWYWKYAVVDWPMSSIVLHFHLAVSAQSDRE